MSAPTRLSRLLSALLAVTWLLALSGCGIGPRAAWSPDGRRIALDLDGKLRIFDVRGERFATLDTGDRWVVNPVFSPDGSRIAYYAIASEVQHPGANDESRAAQSVDLWLRDLGTQRERQLVSGVAVPRGYDSQSTDSQAPTNALHPPEEVADQIRGSKLAWSPDGQRLLYTREEVRTRMASGHEAVRRNGTQEDAKDFLEVVHLSSGRVTRLERPGRKLEFGAWLPDGNHVLCVRPADPEINNRGRRAVSVVAVATDGTGEREVAHVAVDADTLGGQIAPWSAGRGTLLVSRPRKGGTAMDLIEVPFHGGSPRVLCLRIQIFNPIIFSADGRALVYLGGGKDEHAVVYRGAPFTGKTILDSFPSQGKSAPGGVEGVMLFPVISPDGSVVALPLVHPGLGRQELRVYQVESGIARIYPIRDGTLLKAAAASPKSPGPRPGRSLSLSSWLALGLGATLLGFGLRVMARLLVQARARSRS